MNFNQFIKNLFSRCAGIIVSPKLEWIKIKEENDSFFQLIFNFLLPLLFLTAAASMIGSYIQMIGNGFATDVLIVSGLRQVLGIALTIAVSIITVNALIRTFEGTPNVVKASKLVVYSFVPGILVAIIFGMAPWFYIFFLGTPVILDIAPERQSNFSLLSSTTILIIYLLISYSLASIFDVI